MKIYPVKPRSYRNHYSNPDSQGALICQSKNWPLRQEQENRFNNYYAGWEEKPKKKPFNESPVECVVPDGAKHTCAYSDRISQWDYTRYEKANKIVGTGCQGWAGNLPNLNEETLKRFAAVALNLEDKEIWAMRAVHYYNTSTGYSCPVIEAIYLDN